MRIKNHTLTAYALAFLLLLLAGCGGGGGSSTPVETMPETHTVTIPAGLSAGDEGTVEIAAGASTTRGTVTFTCPAGGSACTVMIAADGTVTSRGGNPTVAESAASLAAKKMAEEMAAAEAKAEAEGIAKAIDSNATLADDDGTAGSDDLPVRLATEAGENSVLGGKTVPESTRDQMNKFAAASDNPAMIAGWARAKYERTKDGNPNANPATPTVMDTFVKYNNKAANTSEKWLTYFATLDNNGAGNAVDSIATATGILTLDGTDVAGHHDLFTGDFGITAAHQTIPAPTDDSTTTNVDEAKVRITGSFRGVAGTFACDTGCSRSSDKDGNLSALGSTWTFTPTGTADGGGVTARELAALTVMGVIPDPDFMMLGYWLKASTDADDETTYAMRPFALGNRDFGNVTAVEGTATYSGVATGLYMSKRLTPEGQPTGPYKSGQFTADAMLTAYFGGSDTSANKAFTISGSISDFKDSEGAAINSQWELKLNNPNAKADTSSDATARRNITLSAGTFMGKTMGANLAGAEGNWSGTFHGAALTDNTATADIDESKLAPISASGTFDGHFTNGHVRGAFGADRQ